jgi:hypothetical protein
MSGKIPALLPAVSLALGIAVCLFWVLGTSGIDEAMLRYDRDLANGRAASDAVYLTTDHRLWITIHRGSVPPWDGQLVWGYHVNADRSRALPGFSYDRARDMASPFSSVGRQPTHDRDMAGWGPVRWQAPSRSGSTEEFRFISIGVSHWVVLAVRLLLPLRQLQLFRRSTRAAACRTAGGQSGHGCQQN